jgi:DNA-binding MarR family transcriptional regulator
MSHVEPVDLRSPEQRDLALRIGLAWIELRRGAAMSDLRDHLFGTGDDALDQGQMDTLDALAQRNTWRMSELADALRVDPSTATRAVQRLVNAGLATRNPCDDDGRVVRVTVTAAGTARHAEVAERRAQLMAHVLGAFSPAERVELAALLERLIGAVDHFLGSVAQA